MSNAKTATYLLGTAVAAGTIGYFAGRRAPRVRNQGRHYSTDEWLEFMLEGTLEGEAQAVRDGESDISVECYEIVSEVRPDDVVNDKELQKVKKAFEKDLRKTLKEWGKSRDFDEEEVDELMDDGAAGDVYLTLEGAGVGIWDGRWDDRMAHVRGWDSDKMIAHLRKKLGKYVDSASGGTLQWAMMDAVNKEFVRVCRASNPTGFPVSAQPMKSGKHEGKVMYRPKRQGKKSRPRSYLPPEQADALEADTKAVVRKRQKRGRKENPQPATSAALIGRLKF